MVISFLVPRDWKKYAVYRAADIENAITNNKACVFSDRSDKDEVECNHTSHLAIKGNCLQYSINPTFKFYYDKTKLPEGYFRLEHIFQEELENSYMCYCKTIK